MTEEDFWSNRFHVCALVAGFIAWAEGRLDDPLYVRDLAYRMYEDGAYQTRAESEPARTPTSADA